MKKLITLLLFGWLANFTAVGQVTFNVAPQTITADQGQSIDLNITTNNFANVISFEFSMNWDPAVLQFDGISNTNSNLPGYTNAFPSFGPTTITSSLITSWLDQTTVNPVTLADGSVLFTISFTVVGNPGTGSGINITDTEVSDNTFAIIPSESGGNASFTTNGGTSGGPLTLTAGSASDTTGNQVCIPVTVDNFDLIEGIQHSINYDDSVLSFDSVGALNLQDLSVGSFNNVGGGDLIFSWQDGTTGVGISVPNGTVIYKLYFTIIGAGGSTSNIEFSGSPSAIEISQGGTNNAPLNTNNGSVTVLGNGGSINGVTFAASNESGDNGSQVCVDVTVENFNDLISVQYAMEFDESILAFSSFQLSGANPLGLNVGSNFGSSNASSGELSFSWQDGTLAGVTLPANTSIYEVCFDVLGSAGQSSPFNFISSTAVPIEIADVNSPPFLNLNEVNGAVTVTGTFDGLNLGYNCADAAPGESICVDVEVVDGFVDIVSMQYGFSWDETVLNFTGIEFGNGNPLGLNPASAFGLTNTSTGEASVSYLDGTLAGVNLTNGTSLYQVCFDVIGALGSSSAILFDESNGTSQEVSDGSGTIINFLGNPCTVNIVMNDLVVIEANTTITNVNCNGELTGAIDITVSGGTTPYAFAWSNSVTTEDLSGIGAGTYTVTVTDANSETATETFTVNEPITALSVTGTATGETGLNAGGTIDITPAGGTTAYTYLWSNNATTEDLTNLAAGTYTVTVTDANSCTVEESFTVDAYVCPTITVTGTATGETSPGAGGAVDISVTGGTGSYTFTWSSGNSTEDLSNIGAGTYTVTATDGNNCTGTMTFTVDAFGCPTITITGTATDETSVGAGGAVDISVTGGTGAYTYLWSNTATTEDLSDLIEGTYIVTATDGNNCTGTMSFTVGAYVCPTISITGVVTDESAGGNNGAINITPAGGATPYTFAWTGGNSTEDLSGITGGTYTVTVTDAAGCVATESFVVAGFSCPTITVGFTTSDVSCAGAGDGSITANGTGGTAPYTYAWQQNGATTQTISSLVAGTYTVTITDANDCTATNTTSISAPSAISISVTNTDDLSCQGANDGSITVVVSGGTGTLSVDWGSGMTGTTLSNLAAGSYTPTVTDGNNCVQSGSAVTIAEPTTISVTETITDATCNGAADGAVSLNISGGTSPYTVNWSNGATGTTVSGLLSGTISATITDANSCSISEVYSVGQGQAIDITDVVVTNETVAGSDGAIEITVTPTGSTYLWSNNATTQDIFGLTAGSYIVTVTAPNGCTATQSIPVTNSLGIQSAIVTDVSCNGGNDGSINITTYGGEQPYTWVWSDGSSTEDLNGQTAGTYTVTITDNTGLTSTSTYTIAQPTSISITPSIQHEINSCDGEIELDVTGGTGNYSFVWSITGPTGMPITSQNLTDLCDGTYCVTVTDANDCIATGCYEILPGIPTAGNVTATDVLCAGECTGTITVEINGGTAPYNLEGPTGTIMASSQSYTFGGICAGTYTITGTDANNNPFTFPAVTIDEPTPISISNLIINNQTMIPCNGGIDITVTGGTGSYDYEWSIAGPNGQPITSQDLTNICAGFYNVIITDDNGCTFQSDEIEVVFPISVTNSIFAASCAGENDASITTNVSGGVQPYTYEWKDANGVVIATTKDLIDVVAGVYELTVTDATGAELTMNSITVGEPDPIEINNIIITPPGAPTGANGAITIDVTGGNGNYMYEWTNSAGSVISTLEDISGLIGDDYTVIVTDDNGCSATATIGFDPYIPEATSVITPVSCADECDGIIEVTPATETPGPHQYIWSNGATTKRITDLCPGTYSVTIIDDNNVISPATFIIAEPTPITVTIETSPGQADAIVLGGTPDYLYQWDDAVTDESFISGVRGGIHVLQVTDANGCQSEIFEISVPYDTDCLRTRSVMSPNDDGKNDVFYINCIEDYAETNLAIFNRWGQKIFESDSYDNTWAGTNAKGEDLPEGGYFYVLDYTENGERKQAKGAVTIVRQ